MLSPSIKQIFTISLALAAQVALAAEPRNVSGIYPQLAMFNHEGECGTGAVVPWADRLWVITYGPHKPLGSTDKLYEITPDLQQIVRPESVGGTPANRMIHAESHQLVIGPYFIDAQRRVRAVLPKFMPGRLTGNARDLTDPANSIYFATMEEGLYAVNVHTLEVTGLIKDGNPVQHGAEKHPATIDSKLPGYHGKGLYSGQGRLIYANNGEHGHAAETDPATPSGALGEWRHPGEDWQLVRRNQFTEVIGPGGIYGNAHPATDPVWTLGWDFRSLILMCLDGGQWHSYRLPKASHSYDGAHGWYTEWPRIREIGENDLLMTMHGEFWHFPNNFDATHSAGIAPRSTYLKIIGDFCRWNNRIVIGCDDSAVIEVKRRMKGELAPPGQSQSNLQFLDPGQLDSFGPALGQGGVWLADAVRAGVPSDPYLFSGFDHRALWLDQAGTGPVTFTLEVDQAGKGVWKKLRNITVASGKPEFVEFSRPETGAWVRLTADRDCARVSAQFFYRNADTRGDVPAAMFAGLARPGDGRTISTGWLHTRGEDRRTLSFATTAPAGGYYELNGDLQLRRLADAPAAAAVIKGSAMPQQVLTVDAASVIVNDGQGRHWRLPKGDASFDKNPGTERVLREVVTERDLFNCHGTFYELPAESAGGFPKIRPIATHNCHLADYASYRGMLVLSGVAIDAQGEHIVHSDDGQSALWVGALDDLWQLGKPRGVGGPWKDSMVKAGEVSDPYLMTGYDHKRVELSQTGKQVVNLRMEVDITGTGHWVTYRTFAVPPGQTVKLVFPEGFGAYWVRLSADADTTATATFQYD